MSTLTAAPAAALALLLGLAGGLTAQQSEAPGEAVVRVARSGPAVVAARPAPADSTPPEAVFDADAIEPGAVETIGVTLPARSAAAPSPARYTVEPAPWVRLFSSRSGTLAAAPGGTTAGPVVLPITFAVPARQPAGPATLAHIRVRWPDGDVWEADVRTTVRVRRGLRATLAPRADTVTIEPGHTAVLRFAVTNLGNAPDTVRVSLDPGGTEWRVFPPTAPLVLARGETARRIARITAPPGAAVGRVHTVRLEARGLGSRVDTRAAVRVVRDEPDVLPGLVRVPATLFVGAAGFSAADPRPGIGIALEAGGRVAPETRLSLRARYAPRTAASPALSRYVTGPSFRLGVERPRWRASLGSVSAPTGPLLGYSIYGDGVRARWTGQEGAGGLTGGVFLARPPEPFGGSGGDGHLLLARGGLETSAGAFEVALADLARPRGAFGLARPDRLQAALVRYDLGGVGGHRVSAAAGVLRASAPGGGSALGPALSGDWLWRGDGISVGARGRWTGAALRPTRAAAGDRIRLHASVDLTGRLRASGSTFAASTPGRLRLDGERTEPDHSRGATLGLRWSDHAFSAALVASRRVDRVGLFGIRGSGREDRLRGSVGVGIGRFRLRGSATIGRVRSDDGAERPLREYEASLRWDNRIGAAWLAVRYLPARLYGRPLRIDLNGSLRPTDRLRLQASAGASFGNGKGPFGGAFGERFRLWTSAEYALRSDLDLITGVQYRPRGLFGESRWALSLGIRKRLELPLPLPRVPAARGLVFHDRDADGRRDAGEPGLEGVVLTLGRRRTTTGTDGGFAFYEDAHGPASLSIDVASLPRRTLVLTTGPLPAEGFVRVPVIRASSLTLTIFLDPNGNGARDEGEAAAEEARVMLGDDPGHRRYALVGEDGIVRLRALPPGAYTLTIHPPPGGLPVEPKTIAIRLAPGERATRTIAAPFRAREVRFFGEPAPAPEAELSVHDRETLRAPVHFGFDAAALGAAAAAALRDKLRILRERPVLRLCLTGHTDARGPAAYNQWLGLQRARAVAEFFTGRGVAAARLELRSAGERRPLDPASTPAARARNRRVEFHWPPCGGGTAPGGGETRR